MKISRLAILLLALTAGRLPAAAIVGQEMTVMTGVTESTVVGVLQVALTEGESGATVEIPVPLPRAAAASFSMAYMTAQPSLAVGPRSFTPTGFRKTASVAPGLPRDWETAIFQFRIPLQFTGRGFFGKLMYVQPQLGSATPFLSLSPHADVAASKITFLPGNSHSLELISRNSQPAALEEGMLTLRPVPGELILVRRQALPEPKRAAPEKKTVKRRHFAWQNPLDTLFPKLKKRNPAQPAQPKPILPQPGN
jgi:hypothetical protein